MGDIQNLFNTYSVPEIFLFVFAIGLALKGVLELFNYFYNKIRDYFGLKNRQDKIFENIQEQVSKIKDCQSKLEGFSELKEDMDVIKRKIDKLDFKNDEFQEKQEEVNKSLSLVKERLQEATRSFLIDAHHKFYYQLKGIDDLSLQSIERRYLYYKTAGGDSFIDGMMEDLRGLPRITPYTISLDEEDKFHVEHKTENGR